MERFHHEGEDVMPVTRVLGLGEAGEWAAALERTRVRDITHFPRFLQAQEENGVGIAECFIYEENGDIALFPYLRRPLEGLPFAGRDGAGLFDIITPYCYGGPVTNLRLTQDAAGFLARFRRAFDDHARETGVVTEFVRFHPDLQNQRRLDGAYDRLFLHQQNVMVSLDGGEAVIFAECRPTFRRYIRMARKEGLYLQRENPAAFSDAFARLYGATMARHGQTGFLNFSKDYFRVLFPVLAGDLAVFSVRKEKKAVAAAVFLLHGDYMDYYLGGSDEKHLPLRPNHLLFHEVSLWGAANGYRRLHLGGGKPSLIQFKSGFSKKTIPFHIGHKVHDRDALTRLTALRNAWRKKDAGRGGGHFPPYRRGLE